MESSVVNPNCESSEVHVPDVDIERECKIHTHTHARRVASCHGEAKDLRDLIPELVRD